MLCDEVMAKVADTHPIRLYCVTGIMTEAIETHPQGMYCVMS